MRTKYLVFIFNCFLLFTAPWSFWYGFLFGGIFFLIIGGLSVISLLYLHRKGQKTTGRIISHRISNRDEIPLVEFHVKTGEKIIREPNSSFWNFHTQQEIVAPCDKQIPIVYNPQKTFQFAIEEDMLTDLFKGIVFFALGVASIIISIIKIL